MPHTPRRLRIREILLPDQSKRPPERTKRPAPAPDLGRYTTIPNHPGDMPEGTLRAILKQAGIEPEAFLHRNKRAHKTPDTCQH